MNGGKKIKQTSIGVDNMTRECAARHRESCSIWTHGDPVKGVMKRGNILSIEYEDGKILDYVMLNGYYQCLNMDEDELLDLPKGWDEEFRKIFEEENDGCKIRNVYQ